MNYFNILHGCKLFDGMTEQDVGFMLDALSVKEQGYRRGEYLLRAGESTDKLGVILGGSALIIQEDFWGNRNVIGKLAAGEIFAEAFACISAPLSISVTTDEGVTVLWLKVKQLFDLYRFDSAADANPAHEGEPVFAAGARLTLIENLLSTLAAKNLSFTKKLSHMTMRTTKQKVLSYLSALSLEQGSAHVTVPFDRRQMADYLGVDRSALSAVLSALQREGVISFNKNSFTILKEAP